MELKLYFRQVPCYITKKNSKLNLFDSLCMTYRDLVTDKSYRSH